MSEGLEETARMSEEHSSDVEMMRSQLDKTKQELLETNEKLKNANDKISRLENLYATAHRLSMELKQQLDAATAELEKYKSSLLCDQQPACSATVSVDGVSDSTTNCEYNQIDINDNQNDDTPKLQLSKTWNLEEESDTNIKSIADSVREAAEAVASQSDYVYDAATQLYYDCRSGYYYDAEQSLYYDPQTGAYYQYESSSQTYQFHSYIDQSKFKTLYHIIFSRAQVEEDKTSATRRKCSTRDEDSEKPTHRKRRKAVELQENKSSEQSKMNISDGVEQEKQISKCRQKFKKAECEQTSYERTNGSLCEDNSSYLISDLVSDVSDDIVNGNGSLRSRSASTTEDVESGSSDSESDVEEGELISSSDEDCDEGDYDESYEHQSWEVSAERDVHVPLSELIQGPPCIRAIVKSSNCVDVGKLYILTCSGATIGRQADLNHAIVVPALEVSKMHCEILYNDELQRYVVKDYASQAGTFVNGKRLSAAKVISEHRTLYHQDILRIGHSAEFELHIHPRCNTCDGCEPGVIASTAVTRHQEAGSEIQILSKAEKEMERRRELKSIKKKYGLKNMRYESGAVSKDRDRAAERRIEHGSTCSAHERDELPASVHRAIDSENKGHKLLAKLGWKEGDSLGKSQPGITEPITASVRLNPAAGLGSSTGCAISSDDLEESEKMKRWIKARRRYENCTNAEVSNAEDPGVNDSNSEERLVG